VDWIRLIARLIVLELRNIFPAVAIRALLELLTKLKNLNTCFEPGRFAANTPYSKPIAREVGISQRSVNRIVKKGSCLICMKKRREHEYVVANKQTRLDCNCLLLCRYPASLVHFICLQTKNYSQLLLLAILNSYILCM